MEEMAFFEQNAPVEPDALPPVLDVEATPTSHTCHRHLTQEGAIRDMQIMLNEMERHYGKRPVIYTTVDFYQAILSDGAFSDYPIWVRSTKYHPSVKYGGRIWRFWQYQSDAYVPGIAVKVDKDAFSGTREQWEAFLQGAERPTGRGRSLDRPGASAGRDGAGRAARPGGARDRRRSPAACAGPPTGVGARCRSLGARERAAGTGRAARGRRRIAAPSRFTGAHGPRPLRAGNKPFQSVAADFPGARPAGGGGIRDQSTSGDRLKQG